MSEKTILEVTGMTCSSCAQGINRHLTKKGLKDVDINFESGEVEVDLQHLLSAEEVIAEIRSLGYGARLKGESESGQTIWNWFSKLESRFIIALFFTVPLFLHMFSGLSLLHEPLVQLFLCVPVFIIGLIHFGKSAWGSVKHFQPNMDVLIMLGSGAAFLYSVLGLLLYSSTGELHQYLYFETTATIITLVLLGNIIEKNSLKKTQNALSALAKLQPAKAHKIEQAMMPDEFTKDIEAGHLHSNDLVLVRHGEVIPADGIIYEGTATVDESMMTGESLPSYKTINDKVLSGTIAAEGSFKMIVQQASQDTVLSKMIETVRKSALRKPEIQRLGDRVSSVFVPVVVLISICSFFINHYFFDLNTSASLLRSIAVLVISCPCAMGLATPTAVAVGIGRSARNGILIKGGDTLERLSTIDTIVFDKTGTLTTGKFQLKEERFFEDRESAVWLAGTLEQYSSHPFASILTSLYLQTAPKLSITFKEIKEEPGRGVIAISKNDNSVYRIGSAAFCNLKEPFDDFQVYLCKDNQLLAAFSFQDTIRPDAAATIKAIKAAGIHPVMLSGDTHSVCQTVATATGIDEVYAEKLPEEKTEIIRVLSKSRRVAMVGDGINDAAAIATSTVGIAMGSGTDIAIRTAEIVLLNKTEVNAILAAHTLSKNTISTIRQNLFWALIYNVIAIPMAAAGMLSPMLASLSMAFSDVVVIGNSLRLHVKNIQGLR
ncbi:MAG: cation-translocating P-type ATPase [Bacteroidia bacterium]